MSLLSEARSSPDGSGRTTAIEVARPGPPSSLLTGSSGFSRDPAVVVRGRASCRLSLGRGLRVPGCAVGRPGVECRAAVVGCHGRAPHPASPSVMVAASPGAFPVAASPALASAARMRTGSA